MAKSGQHGGLGNVAETDDGEAQRGRGSGSPFHGAQLKRLPRSLISAKLPPICGNRLCRQGECLSHWTPRRPWVSEVLDSGIDRLRAWVLMSSSVYRLLPAWRG